MDFNSIGEKLRKAHQRLESAASMLIASVTGRSDVSKKANGDSTKPQVLAYHLLGEKTDRLLPIFKDLDVNLQKSGIRMSFRGYVSLTVLTTLLVCASVLIIVPLAALVLLGLPLFLSVLYTLGAVLLAGAFSIIGFYLYPIVRTDSLKRNVDSGLPFTTGYLSILAGAGVPPAQMFRSLAKTDDSFAVSQEARNIVRDVELFGIDIISAMESASKNTSSQKFRELLEGFIATIHSGGDLPKYLSERSRQYMRLKRIALRRLGDTLSVLAEFYVVLLVAGPLILVVMLAVMAMLGGGMPGLLDPRLLLYLLTYIGIPVGSIVFLVMLDMITPKR